MIFFPRLEGTKFRMSCEWVCGERRMRHKHMIREWAENASNYHTYVFHASEAKRNIEAIIIYVDAKACPLEVLSPSRWLRIRIDTADGRLRLKYLEIKRRQLNLSLFVGIVWASFLRPL